MGKVKPSCSTHPKYKGIKAPTVACEDCWAFWFGLADTCKNCGCEEKYNEVNSKLNGL